MSFIDKILILVYFKTNMQSKTPESQGPPSFWKRIRGKLVLTLGSLSVIGLALLSPKCKEVERQEDKKEQVVKIREKIKLLTLLRKLKMSRSIPDLPGQQRVPTLDEIKDGERALEKDREAFELARELEEAYKFGYLSCMEKDQQEDYFTCSDDKLFSNEEGGRKGEASPCEGNPDCFEDKYIEEYWIHSMIPEERNEILKRKRKQVEDEEADFRLEMDRFYECSDPIEVSEACIKKKIIENDIYLSDLERLMMGLEPEGSYDPDKEADLYELASIGVAINEAEQPTKFYELEKPLADISSKVLWNDIKDLKDGLYKDEMKGIIRALEEYKLSPNNVTKCELIKRASESIEEFWLKDPKRPKNPRKERFISAWRRSISSEEEILPNKDPWEELAIAIFQAWPELTKEKCDFAFDHD